MRANQPVTIFGDGIQTRDFVYVKDIAEGISRALEAPNPDLFTACNLGCGRAISVLELAETMRRFFPLWRRCLSTRSPRQETSCNRRRTFPPRNGGCPIDHNIHWRRA